MKKKHSQAPNIAGQWLCDEGYRWSFSQEGENVSGPMVAGSGMRHMMFARWDGGKFSCTIERGGADSSDCNWLVGHILVREEQDEIQWVGTNSCGTADLSVGYHETITYRKVQVRARTAQCEEDRCVAITQQTSLLGCKMKSKKKSIQRTSRSDSSRSVSITSTFFERRLFEILGNTASKA